MGLVEAIPGLWPWGRVSRTIKAGVSDRQRNNRAWDQQRGRVSGRDCGAEGREDLGATEVKLLMDSELVVEQINGRDQVKNDALKVLHADMPEVLNAFDSSVVAHISREENQLADELANTAYDIHPLSSPDNLGINSITAR